MIEAQAPLIHSVRSFLTQRLGTIVEQSYLQGDIDVEDSVCKTFDDSVLLSEPEDYFDEDIIGKTRFYKLLFLIMALKSLEK
jgi:hypothetical protein